VCMFHSLTALGVDGKVHLPQAREPEFANERLVEVTADTKARGAGGGEMQVNGVEFLDAGTLVWTQYC